MTNRANLLAGHPRASMERGTRARVSFRHRDRRGIRRIRRAWFVPPPLPSVEEAERRMRSRPSLIASLTREQIAELRNWDEPTELCGDPHSYRRRP